MDKGKPESGKQYALTGAGKSIANGNTWAESEVKEIDEKDHDVAMPFPDALDQHQIMKKGIVR